MGGTHEGRRSKFWHRGFTVLPEWRQRPIPILTDENGPPHQVFCKRFWSVKLESGTIAYAATESLVKRLIDESCDI